MPITYDPAKNRIRIVDFPESSPCTFEDIYNADKAGELVLVDRDGITGVDTDPVNNTYPLRPADEKVMGGKKQDLWIEIENWSGFTDATIRLIGKDEAGNDQTEDIVVNGNGIYYSSKLWTELTKTQVVSVTGSGSFDYKLVQGQWGVVWKIGENIFRFDCGLDIGDGSIETWLIDANKMILHTVDDHFIYVPNHGHLRLGTIVDEANRTTKDGCYLYTLSDDKYIIEFANGGIIELLSTTINAKTSTKIQSTYGGSGHKIWNCNIIHCGVGVTGAPPDVDFYRTNWQSSVLGICFHSTYANDILITDVTHATIWFSITSPVTIRNYRMINETNSFACFHMDANLYAINVYCKWKFYWIISNLGKVYRQYTFDLKVIDEVGNPISGARVRVWDKDGNLVIDELTDASGVVSKIITRGYYDMDHGSELQDYAPFTLEIAKEGFIPYRTSFTPEEAIDWVIRLRHEDINVDEEVIA